MYCSGGEGAKGTGDGGGGGIGGESPQETTVARRVGSSTQWTRQSSQWTRQSMQTARGGMQTVQGGMQTMKKWEHATAAAQGARACEAICQPVTMARADAAAAWFLVSTLRR